MNALLWDVNISEEEFMSVLHDKSHPEHRWALIRLLTLFPTNRLFEYINRDEFLDIWPKIKDTIKRDFWYKKASGSSKGRPGQLSERSCRVSWIVNSTEILEDDLRLGKEGLSQIIQRYPYCTRYIEGEVFYNA
ncbi:MAG: hypothetical protein ACE5EA_00860 [Nitrospirota bacterium]